MSEVRTRVVAAATLGYLLALAGLVFWPTGEVATSAVGWAQLGLRDLGLEVSEPSVGFVLNIVLFVPLTLLGSLGLQRWSWATWTVLGLAASLTVELGQMLVLPERDPSFGDVAANTLGALAGALLAGSIRDRGAGVTHAR